MTGADQTTDWLYLDYNCFQRGFDDVRQVRIQMEALACQEIFDRAAVEAIQLVWSFMHLDETLLCPYQVRRQEALRLAELCRLRVAPDRAIRDKALELQASGSLSANDALHVACAIHVGASAFVTCDDQLIRQVKRLKLVMPILNPIDYVRKGIE